MKSIVPNQKYVAWKSADELHEISLAWIAELKFIKDEQRFLKELIKSHTMDLISNKGYKQNEEIVKNLYKLTKEISFLLQKIANHVNDVTILIDGIDQLNEEKEYKKAHCFLLKEVNDYFERYKNYKKNVFEHIKRIIKQKKVKRLLK